MVEDDHRRRVANVPVELLLFVLLFFHFVRRSIGLLLFLLILLFWSCNDMLVLPFPLPCRTFPIFFSNRISRARRKWGRREEQNKR